MKDQIERLDLVAIDVLRDDLLMIDSISQSLLEVSFPLKHQLINQMIYLTGTVFLSCLYPHAISGNVVHPDLRNLEETRFILPRNHNNPQILKLWRVCFAFSQMHMFDHFHGLGQVIQKSWLRLPPGPDVSRKRKQGILVSHTLLRTWNRRHSYWVLCAQSSPCLYVYFILFKCIRRKSAI